jgi:hypothetical protein
MGIVALKLWPQKKLSKDGSKKNIRSPKDHIKLAFFSSQRHITKFTQVSDTNAQNQKKQQTYTDFTFYLEQKIMFTKGKSIFTYKNCFF